MCVYNDACGHRLRCKLWKDWEKVKSKRLSITVDHDVYTYLESLAGRRGLTMAQCVRWIMRDGMVHRMELDRQYRALAVDEVRYGR